MKKWAHFKLSSVDCCLPSFEKYQCSFVAERRQSSGLSSSDERDGQSSNSSVCSSKGNHERLNREYEPHE